jgi:hypothetical protein
MGKHLDLAYPEKINHLNLKRMKEPMRGTHCYRDILKTKVEEYRFIYFETCLNTLSSLFGLGLLGY